MKKYEICIESYYSNNSDFNVINKKCAIHNFKVINHIPLN